MTALVAAVSGVVGLLVGSFLNVVIYRVPRHESVVRPRSHCPNCGTTLKERDNIPVVSWLLLRGRCRSCSAPISARYPVVELLTGALFAVVGARFGADAALPAFLVFAATLLAAAAIDLEHFIVPNRLLLAGAAVGAPLLIAASFGRYGLHDLLGALEGAGLAGGALLLIALISPRGMGMGDVKLAAYEGLFLGFLDLGHVFLGMFLGFLLGSIGGIALLVTGLRTRKDHIPFAPFLAAGGLVAVLFGGQLLDLYSR